MDWSWEVVLEVLPSMWLGLIVTVQAALVGALLAYVLGLLLALLKMSQNWIVAKTSYWISECVRRTPFWSNCTFYFMYFQTWVSFYLRSLLESLVWVFISVPIPLKYIGLVSKMSQRVSGKLPGL